MRRGHQAARKHARHDVAARGAQREADPDLPSRGRRRRRRACRRCRRRRAASARTPNAATARVVKRGCAVARLTSASSVVMLSTRVPGLDRLDDLPDRRGERARRPAMPSARPAAAVPCWPASTARTRAAPESLPRRETGCPRRRRPLHATRCCRCPAATRLTDRRCPGHSRRAVVSVTTATPSFGLLVSVDLRFGEAIAGAERPPAHQADAHHVEVPVGHVMGDARPSRVVTGGLAAAARQRRRIRVGHERHLSGDRGTRDAGRRLEALDEPIGPFDVAEPRTAQLARHRRIDGEAQDAGRDSTRDRTRSA